jgi:hypothetical protein
MQRQPWAAMFLALSLVALAAGSAVARSSELAPNHVHFMPTKAAAAQVRHDAKPPKPPRSGGTGISFHGGPVVHSQKVAAIYWSASTIYSKGPAAGSSGPGSGDGSLIGTFLSSLGGSPYYDINSTYTDGGGVPVLNSVVYTQFAADATSAPTGSQVVSDTAIQNEIKSLFTRGTLAQDPSTVYAVFSARGVNLGGGAFTQYCAYHGNFAYNGQQVLYAVMPYNMTNPNACAAQAVGPNGDDADAEVNTLAHEVEETNTDPLGTAWYDNRGFENADKCAWTFGTTSTDSNGAAYNMRFGNRNWLVQRNWVNAGNGGCLVKYP